MCDYFSCIITRDLKALWLPQNPTDHEAIIEHYKLEDKKLVDRDFVRIEIQPKKKDKVTRNRKDWQLKIDEHATLPAWFTDAQKKAEKQAWLTWKESIQINIGLDNEDKGKLKDGYIKLFGSAHVEACGSAHVKACGSAHVEAFDSAHVKACGSAHVKAFDSAHVKAFDSAHVKAFDSAHVEAFDSAHVEACGSAHVEAFGSAHVEAFGSAHVEACGSAHVELKSETVTVLCNDKIFVHLSAQVTKTLEVKANVC